MGDNKRQHYVPQFLLRNFSPDENRKFIRMYNFNSSRHIEFSSITNQCYRDYFYGKELRFEKALASIEGKACLVLSEIISENKYPSTLEQRRLLFDFLAIQFGRTVAAVENVNIWIDKFMKYMASNMRPDLDLSKVKIGMKDAAARSTAECFTLSPILFDLELVILKTKNNSEFIIGDNPVVLFNNAHDHRINIGANGLSSKGLQIFLPVSADIALFFYDRNAYKINDEFGFCDAFPADVRSLNLAQYLNSHSNVYYRGFCAREEINEISKMHSQTLRPRSAFHKATLSENQSGKRDIIMMSRPKLPYMPILRFIKKISKEISDNSSVCRDEIWLAIVTDFIDRLHQGSETYSNFGRFISCHPLIHTVHWVKRYVLKNDYP